MFINEENIKLWWSEKKNYYSEMFKKRELLICREEILIRYVQKWGNIKLLLQGTYI